MRLQELSGGELGREEGDGRAGSFLMPLNDRTQVVLPTYRIGPALDNG